MSVALPSMPTQANRHFMKAVVDLSSLQEIALSEDVYSATGVKLLARGAKVSAETYEKIISHKLVKPIETSLEAGAPPSSEMLVRVAEEVLDSHPLLGGICKWSQGRVTPMGMFKQCRWSPAAGTLLAVSFQRSEGAARHAVMSAMLAMGLANAYRYNDAQLMGAMCLSGLFHDVGEAYVDPSLTRSGHTLTANEWMSYASHPIIGAALAREVCQFDATTQRAILEHHEFADGFGYPRNLKGSAISVPGRLMALAEVLAALILKPSAASRIDIALKIMPGEHEAELVSLVNELLREGRKLRIDDQEVFDDSISASTQAIFLRIAGVLTVYDDLMSHSETLSKPALLILDEAFERFAEVQKAFASTGVAGIAALGIKLEGEELRESQFEAQCVLNEIAWRLQKLSRELALKSAKMSEVDKRATLRLANALSEVGGDVVPEPADSGVVELF